MNRLKGKTAIVTGGAVGIGRACVERMAEEGAKVAILDLLEAEGSALADALTNKGHEVAFWKADAFSEAAMKAAIDAAATPADHGQQRRHIRNAKADRSGHRGGMGRVQAVNVKGVFFGTKHAIPHLRAAGGVHHQPLVHCGLDRRRRHSSVSRIQRCGALDEQERCNHYAAEKIRVTSIHPTYIWTPMVENHLRATSDDLEAAKIAAGSVHPLGHMGEWGSRTT